jgi:Tol biopolymer transport system component/DNA-binding winged helix-turn-helix (wHTH) protein
MPAKSSKIPPIRCHRADTMNPENGASFEFGPFRLDLAEHTLLREGQPVPLTPKNFAVLRVLVQNSGHLVEKERLLKEVWPDSFIEEGALNRSVSILRKTLGDRSNGRRYIETVPTRGYRFVAPIRDPAGETGERRRPPNRTRIGIGIGAICLSVAVVFTLIVRLGPRPHGPAFAGPAHRQFTFRGKEGSPALSPDGRWIAYISSDNSTKRVLVQLVAEGAPTEVLAAPEADHLRWSPDGSELLVWARGYGKDGIYLVPRSGGTPRLIAGGRFVACWSPDGATIAVASYLAGRLWFFDRSGVERRSVPLQDVHWSIWDLDWSAVNGLLLFVSSDDQGQYTVWTVGADGTQQQRVLSDSAEIPSARWAPDGTAVYYFRRRNQTDSLLKVPVGQGGQAHESATITLISGLETDRSLAISADGTRLVYARAPYHSNLWRLDAPGRTSEWQSRQVTTGTSLIERSRISPDGRTVVATIGREPLTNLYTLPMTGGAPTQLTRFTALSLSGVWSPDGGRIAFASTQDGKPRVWMVAAAGGVPEPLSEGDLSESYDLRWSPSGQILYQQAGNRNYYVLDPETRREQLLVPAHSAGWIFAPAYSPDGRSVAVRWNRQNPGIWVIDTQTGAQKLVYGAGSSPMPIGWAADASAIYAVDAKTSRYRGLLLPIGETGTDARILRVSVADGRTEIVASVPFEEIGTIAMTPDARTFLVSVYSSRSDVWIVDEFDAAAQQASRSRRR